MRYYYKDNNGNYYSYKSLNNDDELIKITEEEFNEHKQSLIHTPIEEETNIIKKQNQINYLKAQLAATDYQAIKYAEGWLTEEEYAPIKVQRQAWREEINQLESKET